MLLPWALAYLALSMDVQPDCSVVGQWLDFEGNRTIAVSEMKPGLQDYLRLQPARRYVVHYRDNWDEHRGEVSSRHGDSLLAGAVPSVQQTPEHPLYLTLACYRRELWMFTVLHKNNQTCSGAFFKMIPAASDTLQPSPQLTSDDDILLNANMWAGHPNDTHQ